MGAGIIIVNQDRERYGNLRSWHDICVLWGSNSCRHRAWKSDSESFLYKGAKLRMYTPN